MLKKIVVKIADLYSSEKLGLSVLRLLRKIRQQNQKNLMTKLLRILFYLGICCKSDDDIILINRILLYL